MKEFVKEKKSILIVICVMFIVTISAFTINNFSHAQEEYSLLSTSTQNTIIKLVNNQGVNTENIDSIYFVDLTNKMYSDNATVATFKGTDGNLISAWTEDNALYIGGENTIYPGPELTGAFYGLTNLNIIDMGIANTSNVTGMASMFSNAGSNSQSFTLNLGNKFNTANVQRMNDMFSNTGYNSTIFTLDLGNNFNTSNVTDITHIDDANIYIAALIYDGSAQEPNVIINHNEKTLQKGVDYQVGTTNNINVGTYSIDITGIGNYEGTVSKTYKIEARNITIDPKDQIGTTLDESLDQVTVTNLAPNHRLESIDFRLSNSSIIVSNPKIVDANGNDVTSNYEIMYSIGTLEKKYIGKETINIESNLKYTGQEIKPHVTIVGLEENVDFKVEYSDNIYPGSGSIYITGLGEYTGTILRTFIIGFKPISIKAKNQSLLKNEKLKNGDNYIEVTGLNIGHKVTVDLIKEENNIIIKNVNIKDKDQNSVTHFYDVTLEKGTIKYVDYAIDSDDLYIDDVDYTISYISIGNTLNDIKSLLIGTKIKSYTLTNKNKEEKTTTIATGDYLKVKYDDNTEHFYALSVNGDVSGDAKIELDDIMKIAKQLYTKQNELKGVYLTAADYDNDDNLTLADLMKVAKTVYISK